MGRRARAAAAAGKPDTSAEKGGTASAGRRGLALVGRIVAGVLTAFAVVIVLAIAFKVLGANRDNAIVATVTAAGDFLVGPLKGLFQLGGRSGEVALNWGIAAALYLIVGRLIARVTKA